jgi:plasmid segregation protein ParM
MSSGPVVRAIDLGYGNVKYTRRHPSGALEPAEFPALAVPAFSGHFTLKGDAIGNTDTVAVTVNDRLFHVGPESAARLEGTGERDLHASYARSDRYTALMLGALAYIAEPVIDQLVLGLPISTYDKEEERLVDVWSRKHAVPIPSRKGVRSVEIKRVTVVPQPIGAYMTALNEGCVTAAGGHALLIDPGYFTIDWVVVSPKMAMVPSRSGALQGGVSILLKTLADSLNQKLHSPIQNFAALETALRFGQPALLMGKHIPLEPHMEDVRSKVESFVGDLSARLGELSDIGHIVVCGGGAKLFQPALQARFADHQIAVLDHPEYANLRGFQAIGQKLMENCAAAEAPPA